MNERGRFAALRRLRQLLRGDGDPRDVRPKKRTKVVA